MKYSLIGFASILFWALSLTYSCAQTQQDNPLDPLLYEKHLKELMADKTLIKKMTPNQINSEIDNFRYQYWDYLSDDSRKELRNMEIILFARCYKELLNRVDYTKSGRLVESMSSIMIYPPAKETEAELREEEQYQERKDKEHAIALREYRLREAIFYLQGASERYVAAAWPSTILLSQAKDILKKEGLTEKQIQVLTTGPNEMLVPYE